MNEISIWLALAIGTGVAFFAFTAAKVTGRVLDMTRAQARMRSQNERLFGLFHQLIDLENSKLLVEQEIAQIVEAGELDIQTWHQRVQAIRGGLPVLVVDLMKRFGLAPPPPESAQMLPPAAPRLPSFTPRLEPSSPGPAVWDRPASVAPARRTNGWGKVIS